MNKERWNQYRTQNQSITNTALPFSLYLSRSFSLQSKIFFSFLFSGYFSYQASDFLYALPSFGFFFAIKLSGFCLFDPLISFVFFPLLAHPFLSHHQKLIWVLPIWLFSLLSFCFISCFLLLQHNLHFGQPVLYLP